MKRSKIKKSILKWWIVPIYLVICIAMFIVIYIIFSGESIIPAGKNLSRRDWLAFFGAYITFIGTAAISAIAVFQTHYYNKIEKERRVEERYEKIQPVFNLKIVGKNCMPGGTAVGINNKVPEYNNIKFAVENLGEYPIANVIVFNKDFTPMLKAGETLYLHCAYSDSIDAQKWPDKMTVLLESEFERTEDNYPKSFCINYDDIDGNSMYQIFELKDFDGTKYYQMTERCEA